LGQWEYKEDKRLLLYNNQPFPPYSVITPIGFYCFERFGSNIFNTYGWFKKIPLKETFDKITPTREQDEKGFFVYEGNLDYPYIDGWLYFPDIRFFSKPEVFFKIYRLWNFFYFNIPKLDISIYNKVIKQFYRLETPYLNNDVTDVKVSSDDFLVLNSKMEVRNIKKYVFIVYPVFKKRKDYYSINLLYYKNDTIIKKETLKCIE